MFLAMVDAAGAAIANGRCLTTLVIQQYSGRFFAMIEINPKRIRLLSKRFAVNV
ncbi:hypothetical protein [Sphingomonas sp. DBB INV C78]|uniref:hypothetical protein n=1 Tax=Sphingomonas sp. DBB INV C78 TaxID=3349434 RepID=UPI0036D2C732